MDPSTFLHIFDFIKNGDMFSLAVLLLFVYDKVIKKDSTISNQLDNLSTMFLTLTKKFEDSIKTCKESTAYLVKISDALNERTAKLDNMLSNSNLIYEIHELKKEMDKDSTVAIKQQLYDIMNKLDMTYNSLSRDLDTLKYIVQLNKEERK